MFIFTGPCRRPVLLSCRKYHGMVYRKNNKVNRNSSLLKGSALTHTNTRWFSQDQEHSSLSWKKESQFFDKGPDQILPSKAPYTWHPDGATRITFNDTEIGKIKPVSVPTFIRDAVEKYPNCIALTVKLNDEIKKWSYEQYYEDIRTVAKGFLALGLQKYHSVCILSYNCPAWFLASFGGIFAGGFSTGIYATNTPSAVAYCAKDCRAQIIVAGDTDQLEKVLKIWNELTHLKAVILIEGESADERVIPWSKLMEIGRGQPDSVVDDSLKNIAINQCASLIYTSGTTGDPKGVMLSHDNYTWLVKSFLDYHNKYLNVRMGGGERIVSFLPLSHVAAQFGDMYCMAHMGGSVFFADKEALRGTLVKSLKFWRPTIFLGVPRVYEKICEGMLEVRNASSGLRRRTLDIAKLQAKMHFESRSRGDMRANPSLAFKLCDKILFQKIKERIGLDKANVKICGAAPLNPQIIHYFLSLNIVISETFGLSETSGPHTVHNSFDFRLGSVGLGTPGSSTYIKDPDQDGQGEVICEGRHIMMGYVGKKEKTLDTFTANAGLRTGDLGRIDPQGFIFLTGRDKDIIITSGGKNVAPLAIEHDLLTALPKVLSRAIIIGDQQKYLTAIFTIKTDQQPTSPFPTNNLTPMARDWIARHGGVQAEKVSEILEMVAIGSQHQLRQAIQKRVDKVNEKASSPVMRIQNWCVLPLDLCLAGGELGPTLKVKRNVVTEKYADYIKSMYAERG